MITCGSQAMAEPLLLALLPIANDRMCGAAYEREYEDALRGRYVRRRTADVRSSDTTRIFDGCLGQA